MCCGEGSGCHFEYEVNELYCKLFSLLGIVLCLLFICCIDCSILLAVFKPTSNSCVWHCRARPEML